MLQGTASFLRPQIWKPLVISSSLPPPTTKSLCPDRKCPCCNLQHRFPFCHCDLPWEVCLHQPLESGKQQATPLQLSLPQAEWSQSPQPLLTHRICPRYFNGPLLDSCQFASIFLVELHLFCLSKASVREDLRTRGLCKPQGKEDQGTESWSQINSIIVWVPSY